MKKILVINGPNLNLLGDREPEIYGIKTLKDIENECLNEFKELELVFCQSNSESEIIEYIHSASKFTALIINAGALTHTSIAIHDALKAIKLKPDEKSFNLFLAKSLYHSQRDSSFAESIDLLWKYIKNDDFPYE